jgi:hypothetical protein
MKTTFILLSGAILLCYCCFNSARGFGEESPQELDTTWNLVKTVASLRGEILQTALRYRWHETQKGAFLVPGRESLRSLAAVSTVTVFVSPEVEHWGLTKEVLKTAVELQLRRNGVAVDEMPSDPNMRTEWITSRGALGMCKRQMLHVAIESISADWTDVMAADVTVWQAQSTNLLSTETPTIIIAETWRQSQQVLGRKSNMAKGCREAIGEILETYCNDWLATHPGSKVESPLSQVDNGPEKRD